MLLNREGVAGDNERTMHNVVTRANVDALVVAFSSTDDYDTIIAIVSERR